MTRATIAFLVLMAFIVPHGIAVAATKAGPDTTHASKDAKPGSHEDWCEEHNVPESLDTRCNPALVPAFKATGDWCKIHGLPLSQDLKCNPNLKIVRPPKESK